MPATLRSVVGITAMATDTDDASARFNAAVERAIQRDPSAIPDLIDGLSHELWAIRNFHAHRALTLLGDTAVPALRTIAAGTTIATPAAAHTLHKIDAEANADAVAEALGRCLNAGDAALATEAADVLRAMGDAGRPLAPQLTARLRDSDLPSTCRTAAARALKAMESLDARHAHDLLALLDEGSWEARFTGAVGLAGLGAQASEAVPGLIARLADPKVASETRTEAAQALGALKAGGDALVAALRDRDPWVRLYAARALGVCQPRGVARALAAALADPSVEVRRNVAWALGQLRRKALPAVDALIGALNDPVVGGVAADALARVGAAARPTIEAALALPGDAGRRAAYALGRRDDAYVPSCADLFKPAPEIVLTPEKEAHFAALLERAEGGAVPYDSPHPKYEFFHWAVQRRGCVLHGSNHGDIDILRPVRKSLEAEKGNPKGNINGVYATPDAIWPIFFATVDRINHSVWMMNGPFDGTDGDGRPGKYYQFAINVESQRARVYCDGTVYLLPGDTFEDATGAERASRVAVTPIARVAVTPEDQPFLAQMRGFDTRNPGWPRPDGRFPFLDEVGKIVVRGPVE